jgi:diguanylate cyclase (GGDEF)-like protein
MQYLPVGMTINDKELNIRFWNDSFCHCLDFPYSVMYEGIPLAELFRFNAERGEFGPGDPEVQVQDRLNLARQFLPHRFQRTRANGSVLQITGRPMRDASDAVLGFVTIYEDVTIEVQQRQQLETAHEKLIASYEELRVAQLNNAELEKDRSKYYQLAVRDPLTGLYTRYYMDDAARRLIDLHERDRTASVSLLVFDIDHFKQINDTYGHLAGDAVLHAIGEVLNRQTRRIDIAVRYGGDEFAVFLPNVDEAACRQFAERLQHEINAIRLPGDLAALEIKISAGVAEHLPGETLHDILQRTDVALYDAKRAGRNRVKSSQAGGKAA